MKWLLSTTTNTTALPYSISNFQMGRVSRSADAATSKHALSAITSPSPPPSLWKIKKREAERKNDNEKTQTLNESRTSPASQPTERNTIYRRLDILTFFFPSFLSYLDPPPHHGISDSQRMTITFRFWCVHLRFLFTTPWALP